MSNSILDDIRWDKADDGLVPAVVQDATTKDVLMLGFMNRVALEKTLTGGSVTFWTRSRQKLWTKGETSGNVLKFVALRVNCNNDSLLVLANPRRRDLPYRPPDLLLPGGRSRVRLANHH